MTKSFKNQLIQGYFDRNSGRVYSDLEFRNCQFVACSFGTLRDPSRRPTARRISITDCSVLSCSLSGAILDEVCVNGLESEVNLILGAPAFRHVTLTGRICDLVVSEYEDPSGKSDPVNLDFLAENRKFYSKVDWALDISKAEFSAVNIYGVPASLIRRDPETQVVIRRERVLASDWRNIDMPNKFWHLAIEWFLSSDEQDQVLIAPKRAREFRRLLQGLRILQAAGVADPE